MTFRAAVIGAVSVFADTVDPTPNRFLSPRLLKLKEEEEDTDITDIKEEEEDNKYISVESWDAWGDHLERIDQLVKLINNIDNIELDNNKQLVEEYKNKIVDIIEDIVKFVKEFKLEHLVVFFVNLRGVFDKPHNKQQQQQLELEQLELVKEYKKVLGSIELFNVMTTNDKPCKFPFSHKNVKYYECTTLDNTPPWCATKTKTENWDYEMVEWGICRDVDKLEQEEQLNKQQELFKQLTHKQQLKEFYKQLVKLNNKLEHKYKWDKRVVFKVIKEEDKQRSSIEREDKLVGYGNNYKRYWWFVTPHVMTMNHKSCEFPFSYKGVDYYECTTSDYTAFWCATKTTKKDWTHEMVEWGKCRGEHKRSKRVYSTLQIVEQLGDLNLLQDVPSDIQPNVPSDIQPNAPSDIQTMVKVAGGVVVLVFFRFFRRFLATRRRGYYPAGQQGV